MATTVACDNFDSSHATLLKDGSFAFDCPVRKNLKKVSLASMELPLAQATIESAWGTVHVHEGFDVVYGKASVEVTLRKQQGPAETLHATLPLRLNPITKLSVGSKSSITVDTKVPHGLVGPNGRPLRFEAGECRLVGGRGGDVLLDPSNMEYVSPTRFRVVVQEHAKGEEAGYLLTPPLASPAEICRFLSESQDSLSFEYHASEDAVHVRVRGPAKGTYTISLTPLACALHLPVEVETRDGSWTCRGPTALWGKVELRPGWYAPSRGTTATLPPRRWTTQLEVDYQPRLVRPVADAEAGAAICFEDTHGAQHIVPLMAGHYGTATSLLDHLQAAMASAGVRVRVTVDITTACIRFAAVDPSEVFSLLFHHPRSFPADILGFEPELYTGASAYEGTHAMRLCALSRTVGGVPTQMPSLTMRARETSSAHLSLHATPPLLVTGVVCRAPTEIGDMCVRTMSQGRSFAAGWTEGTVLHLMAKCGSGTAIVLPKASPKDDNAPITFTLHAPYAARELNAGDEVHLRVETRPWQWHVGVLPSTIPRSLVGATDALSVTSLGTTPWVSPRAFDLDPPSYLLMTLSHASGSGTVVHTSDRGTKQVFSKIPLNVHHREFSAPIRDEAPAQGNVNNFTVAFFNPDGTPYHHHGRRFSFSLLSVCDASRH